MRILDRYTLKSYLGPMVATFLIVLFVLLLQFIWQIVDKLAGKGLSFMVIAEFLFWSTMQMITLALPLATMLASIMTLGNLGENNELLAMKTAGIPLQRILRPLMVLVFCVCVGAFFISNNFTPYTYLRARNLLFDINEKRQEIKDIPAGVFYNEIEDISLYISRQDEASGLMHDLMLYDHRDRKGNIKVTVADSGYIRLTENKQHIVFLFYHGYSYEEGAESMAGTGGGRRPARDTSAPFQRRQFDRQEVLIPLEGYGFERKDREHLHERAEALDIGTLSSTEDSLQLRADSTHRLFMQRLLGQGGLLPRYSETDSTQRLRRIYTAPLDSLYAALPPDRQLAMAERALAQAEQSTQHALSYQGDYERDDNQRRYMEIEWFRKFTMPFACLIFFFIGAPLGAIIRKGGLGVPTVVSIFFFLVYWVVDISGKRLAQTGAWDAVSGTLISTLVMLPMGIFLTYKVTTDSALLNSQKVSEKLQTVVKWLGRILRWIFGSFPLLIHAIFDFKFRREQKREQAQALATTPRIRAVYMGTPEFAVAPLQALIDGKYNVVGVVTVPDRPAGRGLQLQASAVKEYVQTARPELPLLQPADLHDEQFLQQLRSLQADVFVVVAFRMLPEAVFGIPPRGTFNLHASLLPQYRGAAPINRAIMDGATQTGVTTFFLDRQMDTGRIIFRETVAIGTDEIAGELYKRLQTAGAALVLKTVNAIAAGQVSTVPQDAIHLPSARLRTAPKITKATRAIDWQRTAAEIHNHVRGLSPYPAATAELPHPSGEAVLSIKVLLTRPEPAAHGLPCGSVVTEGKDTLKIACRDGFIHLLCLQPAGKQPMTAAAFLAGNFRVKSDAGNL